MLIGFSFLFLAIAVAARMWWVKRQQVVMYTPPTERNLPCFHPPNGMIAWWPGEGSAADLVGQNQGTLENGMQFVRGMVGRAFSFDGVAAHVRAGDSTVLAPPSITVEFWMNASKVPVEVSHLVARWGHSYTREADSWLISFTSARRLYFCVETDVSRIESCAGTKSSLPLHEWHHVAGTFDSTDSMIRIYLDGRLEGEKKHYGIMRASRSVTTIGCKYAEGECKFPFSGYIDELSIYTWPLSTDEIQGIFAAGVFGKCQWF